MYSHTYALCLITHKRIKHHQKEQRWVKVPAAKLKNQKSQNFLFFEDAKQA